MVVRSRPVISARLTRAGLLGFETRFPFVQLLPQATTEALLERRVLELGVDIRRGHLVETVEQCEDGVLIAGRKGQVPFRVSASYAVGADGARSIVRRAADINFPGYPARHAMMLGDVVLDAPRQSRSSRW
jgi:2-polyprenyl-6-methoxyphenol hydroxylase-like FAD-dependent oxidoreductase